MAAPRTTQRATSEAERSLVPSLRRVMQAPGYLFVAARCVPVNA